MNSFIENGNIVVDQFHMMRVESVQALWIEEEGMPDELTAISNRWDKAYEVFDKLFYSEMNFPDSLTPEQVAAARDVVSTLTGISSEYKAAYNFLSGGVK